MTETPVAEPGGRLGRLTRWPLEIVRKVGRALPRALEDLFTDRCPQYAAAIAYHVLFSLFPLTIFLVSIDWTLITVRILENMTELSLGPAAAFSVFVIVIVMAVTTCVNALLRRLPAAAAEQAQWGVGGG